MPSKFPEVERAAWQARHEQLAAEVQEISFNFNETVSNRLNQELIAAITERVEAGRFRPSRRWFGLRRLPPIGPIN